METKIVKQDAFTVVGMKYHGKSTEGEIPKLWGALMGRMHEIQNVKPNGLSYGISDNYDEATGAWDYIAGFEVTAVDEAPEGMVAYEIPAQTYAVFTCTMPTISTTYDAIYKEWLPQLGRERADGPEFELYGPTFDPNDPESQFEIYLPVK
ncbi:MAG: AraC family transcriptional regulator [Anaerolineae bacterium]|nr:AraC family transcriptional regulator [Anaerolineae bacterium]